MLQYDARDARHINTMLQYDARDARHINTMLQYDARYTQRHINTMLQYDVRYTQRQIVIFFNNPVKSFNHTNPHGVISHNIAIFINNVVTTLYHTDHVMSQKTANLRNVKCNIFFSKPYGFVKKVSEETKIFMICEKKLNTSEIVIVMF